MNGPTGSDYRVIQIHPTLRCNLRCRHCYSSSGPSEQTRLDSDLLVKAIAEAADEGFNAVGTSGGEPLMSDGLERVLGAAKRVGMLTTVTTNGTLLTTERAEALAPLVDQWAVSVDGIEASHNRMRCSRHAFEGMRRGLALLREAECSFGLIFTLTMTNLDELEAVAEFAITEGASLLQVHPLELTGRAARLSLAEPDPEELAYAFLEVARLQRRFNGSLALHLDAASRDILRSEPSRGFAIPPPPPDTLDGKLADLVSPIVIEADGTVVPLQYGFGHRYALGNIQDETISQLARRWRAVGYEHFLALCIEAYERYVIGPQSLPYFNWYGVLGDMSQRAPLV